jgi:porin
MRAAPLLLRAVGALALTLAALPAHAQQEPPKDVWEREALLGDAGGLRPALAAKGVTVSLQLTGESWSGLAGGLRRDTRTGGLALASITLDTDKAGLWQGGKVFVSAVATFGRFPGAELAGGLQSPTSTEAPRGALLYEAWLDQSFGGERVSLRLGQLRADAEFLTSTYGEAEQLGGAGTLFANAGFGFPGIYGLALPSGGPAYPLATPGARLKLAPDDSWRLLLGVFNGTPRRAAFGLRGGALAMAEVQYLANQGEAATNLPGAYRLGAWFHNQGFADQRTDTTGRSLADPLSTGIARRHPGNWGIYVMADQLLFQTGEERAQGIGVSARLMAAPGDRNQADLQANLAVTWKGAIPGRDDDTLGLGVMLLRHGGGARGLDRDTALFAGGFTPLRGNETVLEATYQARLAGWWQVQPSLQYIARPGGGAADPSRPGRTLRDAWVFGLRSTITF